MNGDNGVQYYSTHAKECTHHQQDKVRQLLKYNKIKYDQINKCFLCEPLTEINYNVTTYRLEHSKELDDFECDCQGFQQKLRAWRANPEASPKPRCAHQAALYETFSKMHRYRREQNVMQGILAIFGCE